MTGQSSVLEKEMDELVNMEKVRDVDGNEYRIVEIAGLRWMADNLRTTRYCNGDTIAHVPQSGKVTFGSVLPWDKRNEGAWCYYNDDPSARDIHREKSDINAYYGKLYNWYAVNDERNICPCGWHPATVEEWNRLDAANGGGRNTGVAIKSNHDGFWKFPDATETGKSGFEALPGGYRQYEGYFKGFGTMALWWAADEHEQKRSEAPYRMLWHEPEGGNRHDFRARGNQPKFFGASVRCVEDHKGQAAPKRSGALHKPTKTVVRDIDGNSYNTVIIGAVEWMMSDLRTTRFSNGDPIPQIPDQELWEAQEEPAWSTPFTPEAMFTVRDEDWTSAQINTVLPFISKDWWHFTSSFFTPDDDVPDHAMPMWEAMEAQWSVPPESIHLYNGYAVLDERGLCPTGWRVGHMRVLVDMYGGNMDAGKALIKEVDGFLNVFAGGRSNKFSLPGFSATYWTGTTNISIDNRALSMEYVTFNAAGGEVFPDYNTSLTQGKSVRCVRGTTKR
jgi:uncharacterized protein (TIGR02145 family)